MPQAPDRARLETAVHLLRQVRAADLSDAQIVVRAEREILHFLSQLPDEATRTMPSSSEATTPHKTERTVLGVTLTQLHDLFFYGIDVRPNCHGWVSDQSIQGALDAGLSDDTLIPHHEGTNRAARVASFVRMIDAGTLPRKFYAELYFRGTALRLKMIDGSTRWRAMQFRNDRAVMPIHVFGQHRALREILPKEWILSTSEDF